MKRRIFVFFLLIVLQGGFAHANPVGNIADPAILQNGYFSYERPYGVFASAQYDSVINRTYMEQYGDFTLNIAGSRIGAVLRDKLIVYSFLGAGRYDDSKKIFNYVLPTGSPDNPYRRENVNRIRVSSDPDFIYGFGVTAVLFEHKVNEGVYLRIGLNASYQKLDMTDNQARLYVTRYDVTNPAATNAIISDVKYRMAVDDYFGAVGLSYQIDNFVPYFGFSLSDSRGEETIAVPGDSYYNYTGELRSDENKGFFAGLSYQLHNTFSLNVEARTRNEDAFTFSAQMRF